MKLAVAICTMAVGTFLVGCGPSPAEIEAAQKLKEAEATARLDAQKLKEAEATARLDAFRAETKTKAEHQEVDRILAPYVQQERLERANAAYKREYIRRGNELADREGR